MVIKLKKGLDLPIAGAPQINPANPAIDSKKVNHVALVAKDYWWFKPTMAVKAGDTVKKGQLLFSCKKGEGIKFTSPVAGKVSDIHRGDRRVFQSLVIEASNNPEDQVKFENYKGANLDSYSTQDAQNLIVESGLWTSFRTRPFSFISRLNEKPSAIFVTAIDTNPLSFDPSIVIKDNQTAFNIGVKVLTKFAKVFVCTAPGSAVNISGIKNAEHHEFAGPHPAGNVGTHIHHLNPVSAKKSVWHIGYQDLIAIGKLFESGEYYTDRVISLAGPMVRNPRLIKTKLGACLCELTKDEFYDLGGVRIISGSVFNGRKSVHPECYLGKYHNQVSILKEGVEREFLGWHSPGLNKFSVKPIYLSNILLKIFPKMKFSMTTSTNGSERSLVPIGSFEQVMPMDIMPTQLIRSLLSKDTEGAQQLGCLELDEEDLALCTFVDPCKHEFGPILRTNLENILKEG